MDYEQKYKEALETVQEILSSGADLIRIKRLKLRLQSVFPELKESKDERIRKGLIKAVSRIFEGHKLFDTDVTREEALAWLEKQGELKECDEEWEVTTGLYKCTKRMFDGTPEGRLWFEIGNLYRCISKNDIAEFESSYGHTVFLIDPVVRKHFIKVKD